MNDVAAINDMPAVARLTAFTELGARDIADLISLAGPMRQLERGDHLCDEGEASLRVYLLLEGWTASSLSFASGARQMLKVHLPGDMLGLPSLALTNRPDSIVALSKIVVSAISLDALGRLFETNARLAALMYLISQEERVMMIDRLAMMGCGSAIQRVAGLILELHRRIMRSEPEVTDSFEHHLSQHDLAELTGITPVHLNRTLQQLRQDKAIKWGRRTATILDRDVLTRHAGLPPRVLNRDLGWLPASKG